LKLGLEPKTCGLPNHCSANWDTWQFILSQIFSRKKTIWTLKKCLIFLARRIIPSLSLKCKAFLKNEDIGRSFLTFLGERNPLHTPLHPWWMGSLSMSDGFSVFLRKGKISFTNVGINEKKNWNQPSQHHNTQIHIFILPRSV